MQTSLEDIRRQGLEALRERLGRAGMIRFLQQFDTGYGDYASERHAWVDATSLEDIRQSAGVPETETAPQDTKGKGRRVKKKRR